MDGNNFLSGYEHETFVVTSSARPKTKPFNDICNIKLGKKYFFQTVQRPSTH